MKERRLNFAKTEAAVNSEFAIGRVEIYIITLKRDTEIILLKT